MEGMTDFSATPSIEAVRGCVVKLCADCVAEVTMHSHTVHMHEHVQELPYSLV